MTTNHSVPTVPSKIPWFLYLILIALVAGQIVLLSDFRQTQQDVNQLRELLNQAAPYAVTEGVNSRDIELVIQQAVRAEFEAVAQGEGAKYEESNTSTKNKPHELANEKSAIDENQSLKIAELEMNIATLAAMPSVTPEEIGALLTSMQGLPSDVRASLGRQLAMTLNQQQISIRNNSNQ